MTQAITGMIGLGSGLVGMIGGMRSARNAQQPGIAPLMYMLSGQDQQAAYRDEAAQLSRQSGLAYEQSLIEAAQRDRQVTSFREEQAVRFANSGGYLAGSPLAVLEETTQLGAQEVEAIKRRGREQSGLLEMQGLAMLRQGSAAAFGGFAQSLQSRYEGEQRAQQLKTQALQSGLSGLQAGVQGLGAAWSSRKPSGYGAAPNFGNTNFQLATPGNGGI